MVSATAVPVTAAVIQREGKVLIVRRAPHMRHAGRWEFPGGKVEAGESPKACLERELQEELGIRARVGRFLCESVYRYPHATIRLLAFAAEWASGEIRLCDHDTAAWVAPSALGGWDLLPADIPVAEAVARTETRG